MADTGLKRGSRKLGLFTLALIAVVGTVPAGWLLADGNGDSPRSGFLVTMVLLTAAVALFGLAVTDRWLGALVDSRRKFSLSRLQIVLWSIVIVSAIFSLALARAQADTLIPKPSNELVTSDKGPDDEPDVKDTLTKEPSRLSFQIPVELWALLGISATTLVGAGIVKQENAQKLRLDVNQPTEGQSQFAAASIVDLVSGEEPETRDILNMAKVQALFFTVLLVFVYAVTVWELYAEPLATIAGLPVLDNGLVVLLGISHGGYLVEKAVPTGGA